MTAPGEPEFKDWYPLLSTLFIIVILFYDFVKGQILLHENCLLLFDNQTIRRYKGYNLAVKKIF